MNALIKCVRCGGRKKLYKVGSAYSHVDTGGQKVDCPMCLGEGKMKSLAEAVECAKVIVKERKNRKRALNDIECITPLYGKDLKNDEEKINKGESREENYLQ